MRAKSCLGLPKKNLRSGARGPPPARRRHECRRGTHECVRHICRSRQCEVILVAVLSTPFHKYTFVFCEDRSLTVKGKSRLGSEPRASASRLEYVSELLK